MSTQTTLQFISDGFKQILESEGTKELVRQAAAEIQQKANANAGLEGDDGYSMEVWQGSYGGGRWVASVASTGKKSMKAESEDKALSRAVK